MEYRNVADLEKLDYNPRKINENEFERLVDSIKTHKGFFEARPLILSNRTGKLVIIAGNQRYEAAKSLKMETVPTYLIEGLSEEDEEFIPYSIIDHVLANFKELQAMGIKTHYFCITSGTKFNIMNVPVKLKQWDRSGRETVRPIPDYAIVPEREIEAQSELNSLFSAYFTGKDTYKDEKHKQYWERYVAQAAGKKYGRIKDIKMFFKQMYKEI